MHGGPAAIPIKLKLLRGNPGKQRIGPSFEPEQTPNPPNPPDFLAGYAREEWERVAPGLHKLGLLSVLDVMPLAAYCIAYQHWRDAQELLRQEANSKGRGLLMATKEGHMRRNPLTVVARDAALDMLRYASEFGATPAARARISAGVGRAQANSKFKGLIET